MRITVLTSLFPGGPRPHTGIFAARRWEEMARRGHEVRVVNPVPLAPLLLVSGDRSRYRRMPRREQRRGLTVHRPRYLHLPGRVEGNARRFVARGIADLRRSRADVAVADYAWPAALAAGRARSIGVPFVVCGRGSDIREPLAEPGQRDLLRAALLDAGTWCAVAEHLLRAMDALAGRPGHGRLVANGVDGELFRVQRQHECRRRLGVAADGALVLLVGHLIPRKAPLLALDAFASAGLDGGSLVVIGDGPLAGELKAAARRRGLASAVGLRGEEPPENLADWYGACTCVLLCSEFEGRPNVVLEALACGRPVVATRTEGAAELLRAFPELLVDSRDARVLGERLRAVASSPPPARALRGEADRHTWGASCDALESCLREAKRSAVGGE